RSTSCAGSMIEMSQMPARASSNNNRAGSDHDIAIAPTSISPAGHSLVFVVRCIRYEVVVAIQSMSESGDHFKHWDCERVELSTHAEEDRQGIGHTSAFTHTRVLMAVSPANIPEEKPLMDL
ncbi:unnamed protein product, partial [Mycena citricolor]